MPQSLVQVYLHIVFSTKQRRPYLNDRNLREKTHSNIVNQETHHRKESFQNEFRRLCKKHGVEIDERYVWD